MALLIELQNVPVDDPSVTFDRGFVFELYVTDPLKPRTYIATSVPCKTMEVAQNWAATIMHEAQTDGLKCALETTEDGKHFGVLVMFNGNGIARTADFDDPDVLRAALELLAEHARRGTTIEILDPPDW